MSTYAEVQGKRAFDWNRFLERAILGRLSHEEYACAVLLASSWVTCACGNQCSKIPRFREGTPIDNELRNLGHYFYSAVDNKDWPHAKTILEQIERRSDELLGEAIA